MDTLVRGKQTFGATVRQWASKALAASARDGAAMLSRFGVAPADAATMIDDIINLVDGAIAEAARDAGEELVEAAAPLVAPHEAGKIPCPVCGAGPGTPCDPRGGSYEQSGIGLLHSQRIVAVRAMGAASAAAALVPPTLQPAREPVWCGVHQCFDDECTKPRPVEVVPVPVNPVEPPANGAWLDHDPAEDEPGHGEASDHLPVVVTGQPAESVPAAPAAEGPVEQPDPARDDGGAK